MSAKVSGKVWELDLDPVDKLVLLALADHADHEGNNVRPGNDLLCAKTGLSQPTVTAKLKKLTDAGILCPQTGTTGRGNIREFSITTDDTPRRQYFIDKDAKKTAQKVKTTSTFQKVKTGSTLEEKVEDGSTFLEQKVKDGEGEKVKAETEKVKDDERKVKDGKVLHDKERARVEPSIEPSLEPSKGEPEDTPFDSFDYSDKARAFETTTEEIQDALRSIFPALDPLSGYISNLTEFVLTLKAPAAYVKAWPGWFVQRYPGQIANRFKFGDTFQILANEGLGHEAWLNGSTGARFVAGCTGNLSLKPVTAIIAHKVLAIGHWLDTQVENDREVWRKKGLVPDNFKLFWEKRFNSGVGQPTAESVMKYWGEFYDWQKSGRHLNGQTVPAKQYCGQCENGWILPTAPNQSARPCACQNR